MHPIHPIGPKTDVLERFLLFGIIRNHLLALRSRVGFFRNEGTRSTPCDPILTFWCVHTISVHSGLFRCLTKLDAKRAEQVQKFVPRSRDGIFRNELIRSTPLHRKLTF